MLYWQLVQLLCCGPPMYMGRTMNATNQPDEHSAGTLKRARKRTAFGALLLLCPILLMSCASDGPARGVEFCSVAQPMYLSAETHLAMSDAEQILSYNRIGEHFCNWQPLR